LVRVTSETQHGVGLDAKGVTEAFLLQPTQPLRAGEGGVALKAPGDGDASVLGDQEQQNPLPVFGAASSEGGRSKEVPPAIPVLPFLCANQPQVGLVHQRRRLQGLARFLLGEFLRR
jgi:hypothetical protein